MSRKNMTDTPQLQALAEEEPWRQGAGLPLNALDPTWEPGPRDDLCPATPSNIEWETGTRWWICQLCGYVGTSYTTCHKPAEDPFDFLMSSIKFFLAKRGESKKSLHQMAFITGTALRYAAVSTLKEYAARLVTR